MVNFAKTSQKSAILQKNFLSRNFLIFYDYLKYSKQVITKLFFL